MQNPATAHHRAKTRTKICISIVPSDLAVAQYPQARSPHLSPPPRHGRSQPAQASQLDLLALLEKSFESALRVEAVPAHLTVGNSQRFWLIHQKSQLRVPGQFSHQETEHILKATEFWDWEIEYRPRTPNCSNRLLSLLTTVCTPPSKVLECAV